MKSQYNSRVGRENTCPPLLFFAGRQKFLKKIQNGVDKEKRWCYIM